MLDHILRRYPDLDVAQLLPNPEKLISISAFSSPLIPVSFSTVEDLQASRQGLKLTHNISLLHENKRVYYQLRKRGVGGVLAVDIESWERDHSIILEIGWSYISWTKGDTQEIHDLTKAEHFSETSFRPLPMLV